MVLFVPDDNPSWPIWLFLFRIHSGLVLNGFPITIVSNSFNMPGYHNPDGALVIIAAQK